MSFVVEPGQKVALVGSTGCGKSSCMALLQRLYTSHSGEILIDDVPIEQYDIHHLRSRVVMVDQHTVLFNASIRENIAYGTNATDDEIIQALKDAKIWEFVEKEPDQLLSVLQEGGANLSGGQRQLLAIARAMVRRPDVILLDEATSALDNESEALVQEALDVLARKGSALVIAHRLSTIMDSDKIVVVGSAKDGPLQGTVVEQGKHNELLARRGTNTGDSSSSSDGEDDLACQTKVNTNPNALDVYMSKDGDNEDAAVLNADTSTTFPVGDAGSELNARVDTTQHADEEEEGSRGQSPKKTSYWRLWNAATGENEAGMSDEKLAEKVQKLTADLNRLEKKIQHRKAKRVTKAKAAARGASKEARV